MSSTLASMRVLVKVDSSFDVDCGDAGMSTKLSPIASEYGTEKAAASYDLLFHAKVAVALADPRPNISHDQVMAEMRDLLESKRVQQRFIRADCAGSDHSRF